MRPLKNWPRPAATMPLWMKEDCERADCATRNGADAAPSGAAPTTTMPVEFSPGESVHRVENVR